MATGNFIRARREVSWHVLGVVDGSGWSTRCGLTMPNDAEVQDRLPRNQKGCSNCFEDVVADEATRRLEEAAEDGDAGP